MKLSEHENLNEKGQYLELDWLLKDRGASRGLVLCPETVLRHDTVTEGWDLERQKKGAMFMTTIQSASFLYYYWK